MLAARSALIIGIVTVVATALLVAGIGRMLTSLSEPADTERQYAQAIMAAESVMGMDPLRFTQGDPVELSSDGRVLTRGGKYRRKDQSSPGNSLLLTRPTYARSFSAYSRGGRSIPS